MNTRLLFCLLWLTPLLCQGASFTSYFLNIEALTNSVARNEMRALTSVFTNSTTVNGSLITGVANPSGLIGMSAVNGVATTLQRSDSRQAIDPAIDPTFTGSWTFAPSASDAGPIITNSANTQVGLTINQLTGATNAALVVNTAGVVQFKLIGEAANTLALRNGTAAQTFNIYGTFTDSSNFRRGVITDSTAGVLDISSAGLGTGATGNTIRWLTDGTARWTVNSSGHLLAVADNTYDIGAAGATRPRNLFLSGSVTAAANLSAGAANFVGWSTRGAFAAPSDGVFTMLNAAVNDFGRLQFGGTTASFPALKRSTTEIQVRLADDSADASLKSGNLSNTGIRVMTPSTLQTLAAANALLANATKVRVVGSGGAVTLTSTPTIADGTDGQYVMIQGTSDANALTVQDQGSLASSNLELGAATRALGAGDVLVLTFDTTASVWYEVSFANN